MLGIIIGVASVISIITIGNGGRDYIVGMIEDMAQMPFRFPSMPILPTSQTI